MRRGVRALLAAGAVAAATALVGPPAAPGQPTSAASACQVLRPPTGLGAILRRLHLAYLRRTTRHPSIRGPIGQVYLGRCRGTRYVLASFSQTYNGFHFGQTDQPEYFTALPRQGWRDRGNTGGEPCQTAPAALLVAWHLVTRCPP